MKYIRTKDGRVAEVKDNMIVRQCDDAARLVYKDRPFVCVLSGNDDIEKETDSIEELFDEYILENKDHTYQSLLVKSDQYDKRSFPDSFTKDVKNGWLSYCYEYLKNGYKIYGAIIIRGTHGEPILKPVAAMNDKEEWELL